jgi:hypothetical protein
MKTVRYAVRISPSGRLEPRGVDAVEHLRVGERRLEDLLDDVFVQDPSAPQLTLARDSL